VQQHAEKVLLGVSLLVFIIALSVWGFPSPHVVNLGTRKVELDKTDEALLTEAQRKKAEAEELGPPTYPQLEYEKRARDDLTRPLSMKLVSSWPAAAFAASERLLPEPPKLRPYEQGPNHVVPPRLTVAELKKRIVLPGKPAANVDRELLSRSPEPVELIVAHVAAVYNVGELRRKWEEILTKKIPSVFAVVAVDVERQEKLPDGTWGQDGKTGEAKKVMTVMADDKGTLIPVPNYQQLVPEFDGTDRTGSTVRASIQKLQAESAMTEILEPECGKIFLPTQQFGTWRIHLPDNEVSRAALDAGATSTVPQPAPDRRTTPSPAPSAQVLYAPPVIPPGTPPARGRQPARSSGEREQVPARVTPKSQPPGSVPPGFDPFVPGAAVKPAAATPLPAGVKPPPALDVPEQKVHPVPTMRQQLADGKVLVWFHDVSLHSRREYRYRYRLVLVNPLLGYPKEVENEADAKLRFVTTDWSDWSEGVSVPEVMEFFVTGGFPRQQKVNVTVFTQRWGQILSARFYLARGQAIGGDQTVKVTNPMTGAEEKRTVNFDIGAIIVGLDFDKAVTKDNVSRTTIELLYLDERGQLKRTIRVDSMDRESEEYRRYQDLKQRAKG
jgi:hypothetical protein